MTPSDTSCPDAPPLPAAFQGLLHRQRTLMLQGPMSGFFSDLAQTLIECGQQVTKVHFNGGDQVFWRHRGALRYNAPVAAFGDWLRAQMLERRIDALVLFGQMRPVHVAARAVALELRVEVFVFEEGYLRPHYVTLERRGVNALSLQPRLASFYRQVRVEKPALPEPTRQQFWGTAARAAIYGLAALLLRPCYRHNTHHRCLNPILETLRWLRGGLRRATRGWIERGELQYLCDATRSKRWFLVPLQVHNDSQVRDHSTFDSMQDFLEHVIASFAQHAQSDALLAVKHHPMDRAYTHYAPLLRRLAAQHGLGARLRYLHDQHLPTLLHHARGVVTINSTVGLQALYHRVPVITLGESVYQVPGLIYEGSLEQFWTRPGVVDAALNERFRAHLIAGTQLNASFYARRPALEALRTARRAASQPSHAAEHPPEPVWVQRKAG